jgi:hypothetical protein
MELISLPTLAPLKDVTALPAVPQIVLPAAAEVAVEKVKLRPLARSQMRAWAMKHLKTVQGGLCPLCLKPIDMSIPKEGVTDHDHDTGRVRGVLHRSCNAAEGKASNAIAQWGAKSHNYPDIIAYMERLLAYLKAEPTQMIYHSHKTPDEKRDARNAKARAARARVRAAKVMKSRKAK